MESEGSSISFGGRKGGSKSSKREPSCSTTSSMRTLYLLSGVTMAVKTWVPRSPVGILGGFFRCFSSY